MQKMGMKSVEHGFWLSSWKNGRKEVEVGTIWNHVGVEYYSIPVTSCDLISLFFLGSMLKLGGCIEGLVFFALKQGIFGTFESLAFHLLHPNTTQI